MPAVDDEGDLPVDIDLAVATFHILGGAPAEVLPRHRHALSRNDVRRTQAARILASAIRLFGDAGYATTTVAQIADDAKVSRRTVYDLYDGKEALFLATYQCTALLMARAGAPSEPLTVESLPAVIRGLLKVVAASPPAARMFFLEATGAGDPVRARRFDAISEFVDRVTPGLQGLRAEAAPQAPALSRSLCAALVAAAIELIVQHLSVRDAATLPDCADAIAELCAVVVLPGGPA